MSDSDRYSSDPKRRMAGALERIADVLEERLPPLSEAPESRPGWFTHAEFREEESERMKAQTEVEQLKSELAALEKVYETHTNELRAEIRRLTADRT